VASGAGTVSHPAKTKDARPKILFITSHDPDSADYGAVVRARNICKLLGRLGTVRVVLAGFRENWGPHADGTCAGFELLREIRFEWSERISVWDRIRHEIDPRFMNVDWFQARTKDVEWLQKAVTEHDVVWVYGCNLANRCNIWHWPHSVLDVDDIHSEVYRSQLKMAGTLKARLSARRKIGWWTRHQELIPERFDACCVCSESDLIKMGLQLRPVMVRNGFDQPGAGYERRPEQPLRVGFIGSFEHAPNVLGARWFVRNVWPRVLKKQPTARLRLVGTGGCEIVWPEGQNIEALGFVADAETEMSTWALSVAPILTGGGTRVKMAESFSRRCPVVSTSLGAYGYDVTDGQEAFVTDDPELFAERCLQILEDPALGVKMAENAWQKFLQNWTWEAQADRVAVAVERALAAKNGAFKH
jgi:glycosyltransferase involved in cell wall biosynthesis